FAYWWFSGDREHALIRTATVLVIACPHGNSAETSWQQQASRRRFSRQQASRRIFNYLWPDGVQPLEPRNSPRAMSEIAHLAASPRCRRQRARCDAIVTDPSPQVAGLPPPPQVAIGSLPGEVQLAIEGRRCDVRQYPAHLRPWLPPVARAFRKR